MTPETSNLIQRLRLQPEDLGGPSRMDMLRERKEAADALAQMVEQMERAAIACAQGESELARRILLDALGVGGHGNGMATKLRHAPVHGCAGEGERAGGSASFAEQTRQLGYPDAKCPAEYGRQWREGEQASFDEQPDACPYRLGSDEAFWWQQGFEAAEAVTAALRDDDQG